MRWYENNIYNRLQDDVSKEIFRIRCEYSLDRNSNKLNDQLYKLNRGKYRLNEWNQYKRYNNCDEGIVIWGTGYDGIRTYELLKEAGERIVAFGDNSFSRQNIEIIDGIESYSIEDVYKKYGDCTQVIGTRKYVDKLYPQLLAYGFDRMKIFYPMHKRIMAACGKQYFDCPEFVLGNHEVFLDCGSLNAFTSLEFSKLVDGEYDHIYTFDPDNKCEEKIITTINQNKMDNITFINKGLSDFEGEVRFINSGTGGSTISEKGESIIKVTTIDSVLNGGKATFIKMDIEGAELSALKGAEKTIRKYRPKLAISLYHKPEDIMTIPDIILEYCEDYKLYLRHYSSCEQETVLYAI